MFQTDPNLFLQSLASEPLTWLMIGVSLLGYVPALMTIAAFVLFVFDLRRGFVLVQLLLWNGLLTTVLKELFGLPRPPDVDVNILNLDDGDPNLSPFDGRDAASFFGWLDPEVVAAVRQADPEFSRGFPSGHVSTATALFGGIALLFRQAPLVWGAAVMMVAMALSRMYLGRHFLADVLGGAVLGLFVLLACWRFFLGRPSGAAFLGLSRLRLGIEPKTARLIVLAGVAPLLLVLLPGIKPEYAGYLVGFNLGYLALLGRGLPSDAAPIPHRLTRFALSLATFVVATLGISTLLDRSLGEDAFLSQLAGTALPSFLMVWGTVAVGSRLGLFRPSAAVADAER